MSEDNQGLPLQLQNNLFHSQPLNDPLDDATCWKPNLMLPSEQVKKEDHLQLFRKRTSFEDNLINQHIGNMLKILKNTQLATLPTLPNNDSAFSQIHISE